MTLRPFGLAVVAATGIACGSPPSPPAPRAVRSVVLITIDTLRADHVGAYGATGARTPTLDGLARDGARFDRAWATAPITLPSHASLMSGRYPPAHRGRHNGVSVDPAVPTLAVRLKAAGFVTGAFVSAFPLDKRFGLAQGFDVYDDVLPRGPDGRPVNERPGSDTVTRAIAWWQAQAAGRVFLWVHLFEPHAPYGAPGATGSATARYDEDITTADHEAGRLLAVLGDRAPDTLVIVTADHGEAFGEHGEIGHSMFVYDTTLRVPLLLRGPAIDQGLVVRDDVSLVDVAPTIAELTGIPAAGGDGLSLVATMGGRTIGPRELYAESFAPYFDFGWAGLRSVRDGAVKYIAAPKPELYDLARDSGETVNRVAMDPTQSARLQGRADRWSPTDLDAAAPASGDATARLRALGYLSGGRAPKARGARADPKDMIGIASRMAMVTSGEVHGQALVTTLQGILRDDPANPQAHLRLGFAEIARGQCRAAEPHLRAALTAGVPTADAGLGLAQCRGEAGDLQGAAEALAAGRRAEPGNPVVAANLGLLALRQKRLPDAVALLREAVAIDPGQLEARFALARALALSGDRSGALAETERLLGLLPSTAPQRAEVERLRTALR